MAAAELNLVIEKGATFRWPLTLSDVNGPMDLTGFNARMHVRETVDSPEVLLDLSTYNGAITVTAAGVLYVKASAAQTDAITARKGVYDLELEYPDGEVDRLFKGKVTFDPSVTRTPPPQPPSDPVLT